LFKYFGWNQEIPTVKCLCSYRTYERRPGTVSGRPSGRVELSRLCWASTAL